MNTKHMMVTSPGAPATNHSSPYAHKSRDGHHPDHTSGGGGVERSQNFDRAAQKFDTGGPRERRNFDTGSQR